ncbi:MAG: branched-chain amino acid ABC transporter permease [Alphaproteobacteria bacterium]|nr:MAG: branched-chain amino acid ABC transporter permease [Alphaproteobacteria bacterium]
MNSGTLRLVAPGAAVVVALLLLPLFGLDEYWIYILTIGFYYAVLAASWSLLVGYVGRISFAHAAMSGIGAYASILASTVWGLPLALSIPFAGLSAALIGLAIGRLCLRLHGAYLGLTTIAFSEIVRITITAEHELTRGSLGLAAPALFETTGRVPYYYSLLALLGVSLLVMWLILRSRIGLFFAAIREDEDAAASLGVRVVRWKIFAFSFSSAVAGIAGAFYAHFVQLVAPSMMSIQEMGFILSMAVIGGFQNIFTAALGGIFLEILLEVSREIGEWRMTIFGLVVIAVLRFAPNGLFGWAQRLIVGRGP